MSTEDEGFVVVVTEGPIVPYDTSTTIVVFAGQTEHNDEMIDVTFGVDFDTAESILMQLAPIDGMDSEPYCMVLVEPWQILSGLLPTTDPFVGL